MKLKVKITPQSKRNEIIGWFGDQLKIRIAAVPEKGRANKALVKFLADQLHIPRDFISIQHGHASPSKLLEVKGLCLEDVEEKLDVKHVQENLL